MSRIIIKALKRHIFIDGSMGMILKVEIMAMTRKWCNQNQCQNLKPQVGKTKKKPLDTGTKRTHCKLEDIYLKMALQLAENLTKRYK